MLKDYNPNPVKLNRVDDCSVRAVAKALDVSWETAYVMLMMAGYSMGDMPHSNIVISAVLRQNGFSREFPPSDCPDCFTVEEFCEINPEGTFVLFSDNHVAIVVSGEERVGSRSIFTPAAVNEYGNVTSRAVVDVPKGCCFTVSVEFVNGSVNDPATTPTPIINVIDGSLSITRTA